MGWILDAQSYDICEEEKFSTVIALLALRLENASSPHLFQAVVILDLKKHGGWRSSAVAEERYVENSVQNKIRKQTQMEILQHQLLNMSALSTQLGSL